jgi:hypothetical protein
MRLSTKPQHRQVLKLSDRTATPRRSEANYGGIPAAKVAEHQPASTLLSIHPRSKPAASHPTTSMSMSLTKPNLPKTTLRAETNGDEIHSEGGREHVRRRPKPPTTDRRSPTTSLVLPQEKRRVAQDPFLAITTAAAPTPCPPTRSGVTTLNPCAVLSRNGQLRLRR